MIKSEKAVVRAAMRWFKEHDGHLYDSWTCERCKRLVRSVARHAAAQKKGKRK